MPKIADFIWSKFDDGSIVVQLDPPTPIGGELTFVLGNYFGGEMNTIQKSCASGFNGVSGITVTNSGGGEFSISLTSLDTSGLDYGNFAYKTGRATSGAVVAFTEGFMVLTP